jgi:hypothetical protein
VGRLARDAQADDVLDPKLVALIRLNLDVTATHLYRPGVSRHVREAIRLGATRAEILEVFKLASVVGIHACAVGVPALAEELARAGIPDDPVTPGATPVCDAVRANGMFNPLGKRSIAGIPSTLRNSSQWASACGRTTSCRRCGSSFSALPAMPRSPTCTATAPSGISKPRCGSAPRAQILAVLKIVSLQGIEACELAVPMLDRAMRETAA